MTNVLALTWFGESIFVAVVLVVYAAVIWMIVDILRRPDFSGVEKVLWIVAGMVFSIATLIVYVLWVRKRDYPDDSDSRANRGNGPDVVA